MRDWLLVYNVEDVVLFIEAFRKMAGHYYPDKIDVYKDPFSIPGISMTYVLELYSPGNIVTFVEINDKSSSTVAVTVS